MMNTQNHAEHTKPSRSNQKHLTFSLESIAERTSKIYNIRVLREIRMSLLSRLGKVNLLLRLKGFISHNHNIKEEFLDTTLL